MFYWFCFGNGGDGSGREKASAFEVRVEDMETSMESHVQKDLQWQITRPFRELCLFVEALKLCTAFSVSSFLFVCLFFSLFADKNTDVLIRYSKRPVTHPGFTVKAVNG